MKTFLVALCIVNIFCTGKREISEQVDLREQSYDSLPQKKLIIKDESKYSQSFINSLKDFIDSNSGIKGAELIDSTISFSPKTEMPVKFPTHPKINKNYTFTANVNTFYYELNLRRINYSDLDFHFVMKDGLRIIHESKGVAIISPGFINAAEIYEDEQSDTAYSAYGYETNGDNCFTSLIVSTSLDEENELKAKIKEIACADTKVKQRIEKMPTLRAKVGL